MCRFGVSQCGCSDSHAESDHHPVSVANTVTRKYATADVYAISDPAATGGYGNADGYA